MCEELGDEEMMTAYIEEYGKTSMCSVETGSGCDEKEMGYIEKAKAMSAEEQSSQLKRLENMAGGTMKPDLKRWLIKRKKILSQLVPESSDEL